MYLYYEPLNNRLKKLGFSGQINDEILQCYKVKQYPKNEYFARAGEISDKIGYIVNGLFFMSILQENGHYFVKEFITSSQFLLATLDPHKKCCVDIQSIKNSTIIEAKYSDIQYLFAKYPQLALFSKKRTEEEIDTISQRMAQYAIQTAKDRYILFREKYGSIEDEIPQFLIASYLGITPTQLSRIRASEK